MYFHKFCTLYKQSERKQ